MLFGYASDPSSNAPDTLRYTLSLHTHCNHTHTWLQIVPTTLLHNIMRVISTSGDSEVNAPQGFTLVLPAVAFANIGELSIDVLICTMEAQLIARLDSDNVLPCVGNNAYQMQPPGLLATPMELYKVPGSSLYLLQQRAPTIPGRQKAFAAELAAWAKAAGFSQVLLLCGLDAQYRREQQLEGSQLRYLSSSSSSSSSSGAGSSAALQEQGQQPEQQQQQLAASCKAVGLQQLEPDVIENEQELHGLLPPWPILEELQRTDVPHTLLSAFAAEGDNTADAMRLAGSVLYVLALQGLVSSSQQQQSEQALRVPCSWASLFGRRAIDSTLF